MAEKYPMPPFLAVGQVWPPTNINGVNQSERLQEIRDWRELFKGVHVRVFEEYYKRLNTDAATTQARDPVTILELLAKLAAAGKTTVYEQEIDLPQALSLLWADLLAGRPPRVSAGVLAATAGAPATGDGSAAKAGPAEEAALQRLTTDIVTDLHEGAIEQSYAGDGVFVARWTAEGGGQVVAHPADQWIPWSVNGDPKRITAHVLFRQETERPPEAVSDEVVSGLPSILTVEIHYRGLIRYRRYKIVAGRINSELPAAPPDGAPEDQELPGVTEFLVQPCHNFATAADFCGVSDYRAIETIVAELDVRSSQWGRLGDKFTAPVMYGPEGVLEEDLENPGVFRYKTTPDGKYIAVSEGEQTPGYAIWDPQFEMQIQTWDRLMEAWYLVSGTTPAAFSAFKDAGGGTISGIALRLRMARPLQVAGRKRERLEPAVRRALLAAQQLEVSLGGASYRPTMPVFEWPDGLPADPKEGAETEQVRWNSSLTTRAAALRRLDGLSEQEAEEEAEAIAAERAAETPVLLMPGAGKGLNGPGGDEGKGGPPDGGS